VPSARNYCGEQVIGRALRRQSYDLNEEGLFNVEYADVLGIPFDFTAKPVVAPPQPPRETIHVKAVRPDRDHLEIRFPHVAGYRVELPEERLTAEFNDDSILELTPDLVGPSITKNQGIIGEDVDLNLEHLEDMRRSTLLFHVAKRLLYTKWRDPGEEPKLHLFNQLKRITKQWLDHYLVCRGDTYPALLMYQELADMACERITTGITRALVGERPIKAVLDPYNPTGSTIHVNFNTSKKDRWQTDARRCHINWVILDSDWEAEFCRVAESHPWVQAYVKNHNLGLEVPYRYGSETRIYRPDFIVLVDDGHEDPLHLIVEIKGYRREDAKDKKATIENYWVPGVNNNGQYGRWAFNEFTEIYRFEADFEAKVQIEFDKMIKSLVVQRVNPFPMVPPSMKAHLEKQFGNDAKWVKLYEAVWSIINSAEDHAFSLSDFDTVTKVAECDIDDLFALLSLLSRPTAQFLKMEFRSESKGEVELSEFISKLTDWWRRKSMSDEVWEKWASDTKVRWIPVGILGADL
jgi:type III restriction enzyme